MAAIDWILVETLLSLDVVPVAAAQTQDYQAWVMDPAIPEQVVDIGLRAQPNRELAASLNLDLILISSMYHSIEPTLSQIAPVQTLNTYSGEGNLWQNLENTTRRVGELTNRTAKAETVIEQHRQRIEHVKENIPAETPPFLVVQFIDDRHVRVYGEGSLYDMVIHQLGLQNAWEGDTNSWGYNTIGIEELVTPGYLVIVDPIPMTAAGVFDKNQLWQTLPAVREDRVLQLPAVWSFGALPSAVRFADELHQALSSRNALSSGQNLSNTRSSATPAPDLLSISDLKRAVLHYSVLPRMSIALLVGAALGLAGVLMQQVLRNPIASPTTLGVASGAQFGLLMATLFAPGLLTFGSEWVALVGGTVALLVVFLLSWHRGLAPVTVVLAGLVVNLYISALSTVFILFHQEKFQGLLVWAAGSLAQNSWDDTLHLLPRLALAAAAAVLLARPLRLLELDETNVRSLGVSVRNLRLMGLGLAVFITASAVSLVGIVGFLGLAAPAIVKLMGARTLVQKLFWAPVFGGVLLLATDLLLLQFSGRLSSMVPTGAMTGLLGAPLLLWLIPRLAMGSAKSASSTSFHPTRRSATKLLLVLLGLLFMAAIAALFVTQSPDGWTFNGLEQWQLISDWRLPRALAAAGAGILLALAGTAIQRMTGNPMASPEVLGISSGTAVGLVITLWFFTGATMPMLILAGTFSAFVTLAALVLLNVRTGFQAERLLLTGIAIAALFEPLKTIFLANGDPRTQQVLAWMSGSTYYVDFSMGLGTFLFALLAVALAPLVARWLDLLPLGRKVAVSLGLNVDKVRLLLLALVAILTAFATLIVGPLSFAGLLAPHLARMLGLSRALPHLLGAALVGALLMVSADWLGRQVLFPQEIPAGLIAALLGGAYFMWGLRKH